MATHEMVDSIVDEMISRIRTNIVSLGGTVDTPIIEGDEEPHLVRIFPSIYIMPLIEGGDSFKSHMGGVPNKFHEFPITIVGLYRKNTVTEFLRTCRQYGFVAADLFSDSNYKVIGTKGGAAMIDHKMQPAYFRVGDKIVHSWSVKMTAKSVTR